MDKFEAVWVQESALELGITVSRLTQAEFEAIETEVDQRFAPGNTFWIWERLIDAACLQDDQAWRRLDEFIGGAECILCLNNGVPPSMFRVAAGSSLSALIGNAPGFEFWITNGRAEFVLGLNHHDVLYGAGSAKQWVKSLDGNGWERP